MKTRHFYIIGSASLVVLTGLFLSLSKTSEKENISNSKVLASQTGKSSIKPPPVDDIKIQAQLKEHQAFLQHALSLANKNDFPEKSNEAQVPDPLNYENPQYTQAVKDYEELKPAYEKAKKDYNIAFEQYYKAKISHEELVEKDKQLEDIRKERLDKLKIVFDIYKLTEADRQAKILSHANDVMEKWNE